VKAMSRDSAHPATTVARAYRAEGRARHGCVHDIRRVDLTADVLWLWRRLWFWVGGGAGLVPPFVRGNPFNASGSPGASARSRTQPSRSSSGVRIPLSASAASDVASCVKFDAEMFVQRALGYFRPRMSKFRSQSRLMTRCFSSDPISFRFTLERVEVHIARHLRRAERAVPLLALGGERLQDVPRDHHVVMLDRLDNPPDPVGACGVV